ncbi:MAG: 4-alpha-glucanotransferase, partial [Candidatus Eremiobacteraeota bacterium]|nr:4-alpha-glucanotransferase [Candidatus Eremiobacteraeota bacterium]
EPNGAPRFVAGVPPDYFSKTGQLWGNPLYRWDKHKKQGYEWWMKRLSSALSMFDFLRIDHFRGFAGYWQVPAGEETAVNGKWVKGPGAHFFKKVKKEFPDMPIVAEDLGDITPDVHELRDEFGLPGMVVVQFAFGGGPDNKFLPHHHQVNSVVYTGTHDNDTSLGWYKHSSTEAERQFFHLYTGVEPPQAGPTLVRMALNSVAHTAIVPFQDILGMGSECRMNTPSQASGNWQWRFVPQMFTRELMQGLRGMTYAAGRLSQ